MLKSTILLNSVGNVEFVRTIYDLRENGQAGKSAGRMPWHREPMKDVISCEKPGGDANDL